MNPVGLPTKTFIQEMSELPDPEKSAAMPVFSKDPILWTQQTRRINNAPFSFEGRPYLEPIYRETAKETYIVKGRQTELTEMLVNKAMHNAWNYHRSVGMYMSYNWDHTQLFSNFRIRDTALEQSPEWQKFLPFKNHFTMQSTLNNFSKLFYRTAFNRFIQSRGFSLDFLYVDEMQSCDVEYIDVAIEAMAHSKHARIIGVGTGDYEDTWWYRRWHLGNQYKWDYKSKTWLLDVEGDPLIHSYHIPQAMVPYISDAEIERKINAAQSRNIAIMEIMGWWVKGVRKPITESMMRACFDSTISMVDPESVNIQKLKEKYGPIFVGYDWGGGKRSHTVVWFSQVIDEEIPILRLLYAAILDDPDVDRQADKAIRLTELMEPDLGVMDQGGGARQVQKVEARFHEGVHKCWYSTDTQKPLNLEKLKSENLVKANRTISIDGVIDLLSHPHVYPDAKVATPRYQLPARDPKQLEWIIPHFTCLISKNMKMASGQEYVKYDKEPADVHDALMACVYNYLAFLIWKEEHDRHAAFHVVNLR